MVLSAKLRNRRLATPCTNYDTSGKNVESGVLFIAYEYLSQTLSMLILDEDRQILLH